MQTHQESLILCNNGVSPIRYKKDKWMELIHPVETSRIDELYPFFVSVFIWKGDFDYEK